MLVLFARQMGMCFGVKDALALTEQIADPHKTTILGELVHNRIVQKRLEERGFHTLPESRRDVLPSTPKVMVTAHGVSNRYRNELQDKEVVDTTCPLVRRVHKTVLHLAKHGYHVVIVGKPGHVEVEGLVGDLESATVWPTAAEARPLPYPRIAVASQTTTPPETFRQTVARIKELNPGKEIRVTDTICTPTRERQAAVEELLPKVELLVVVGGKNSNNTRRLCEMAERYGKPFLHVEDARELQPEPFLNLKRVGLTAGTSTPDDTIQAVHRRLLEIDRLVQAVA